MLGSTSSIRAGSVASSAYNRSSGGTSKKYRKSNLKSRYSGTYKKRSYRKVKYTSKAKLALNGITFNQERVSEITDNRCVYVIHHDMPFQTITKAVAFCLLKKLLNAMQIEFNDWTTSMPTSIIPDGVTFALEWKPDYTSPTQVATLTKVAADTSYLILANRFWADTVLAQLLNATNGFDSGAMLISMETNVDGRVTRVMLRDAKMQCKTTSTLAMQNRSIPAADDDEADDVNNIPLFGKSYEGKGNGFIGRDNNTILPPSDSVWGWGFNPAGTTTDVLAEPPEAYHFQYVKKVAKVDLGPGQVKTSVLTGSYNMNIDRFLRIARGLQRNSGTNAVFPYNDMGKCRMFALERRIARLGGEIAPGIVLASTLDLHLVMDINLKRVSYAAPVNIVI